MSSEAFSHVSVLLHEAVDALAVVSDGVYVDGTFGRGGHSRLILSHLGANGRLVVFDKDPQAVAAARELAAQDGRVSVVHDGFSCFQTALDALNVGQIDGALFDLGISSPQIDDGSRGFSFRFDAPLDMRMDTTRGMSAAEWLAAADEDEICEVIRNYGEERFARQIARAMSRSAARIPSIQPASWRRSRRKTSVLASADKTRRRGRFRPFGFSSTASLKK